MDPARAEVALTARGLEDCDAGAAAHLPSRAGRGQSRLREGRATKRPWRRCVTAIAAVGERAALGEVAEIVGFVLRAAVAAAQSERDEMSVLLAQALQVERGPRRTRPQRGAARHGARDGRGFAGCRCTASTRPRRRIAWPGLRRRLATRHHGSGARAGTPESGAPACEEYRRLANQARCAAPDDAGGADRSRMDIWASPRAGASGRR